MGKGGKSDPKGFWSMILSPKIAWTGTLIRVFLGVILGWAGVVKIHDPEAFIKIVKAYNLLPEGLVVLWGIFLPWIELVTGIFLFSGLWHKSAVLSSFGLFFVFSTAVSINILRGADIACGCFGFNDTNLYVVLLQDLVLLLCCYFLFFLKSTPYSLDHFLYTSRSAELS